MAAHIVLVPDDLSGAMEQDPVWQGSPATVTVTAAVSSAGSSIYLSARYK